MLKAGGPTRNKLPPATHCIRALHVCRWLLQAADCTGSDHVPLTQEYLADMLGMRRTTVTLLAQELQKRQAIRYTRGRITLLDRNMLEAGACDCYEAIKRENHPLRIEVD